MALADMIAGVADVATVYAADLATAEVTAAEREAARLKAIADAALPPPVPGDPADYKTPADMAIDGVAYHVFNTLRGSYDLVPTAFETQTIDGVPTEVPIAWATFEEVRAIIAQDVA